MKTIAHIVPQKLSGRHRCECQARQHALIRNCAGCGRIVCEQEGSGPCVFCGRFVCTREEAEIIDKDARRGAELHRSIMKKAGHGTDISRRKQEEEAEQYRDQLLRADRENVVRNRILDLDSDYYNVESSEYLTADERRRIQHRKDELKLLRAHRARRAMTMDLDLVSASVHDTTGETAEQENIDDSVISEILKDAEKRRAREQAGAYQHRDPALPTAANFAPTVQIIYPPTAKTEPDMYDDL